jgi:hypothetical protein
VGKIAQLGAIMIAVPGDFAHPTLLGSTQPMRGSVYDFNTSGECHLYGA